METSRMSRKALFANLKVGLSEGSQAERDGSLDSISAAENIIADPLRAARLRARPNSGAPELIKNPDGSCRGARSIFKRI